jgi:hypothetical protein
MCGGGVQPTELAPVCFFGGVWLARVCRAVSPASIACPISSVTPAPCQTANWIARSAYPPAPHHLASAPFRSLPREPHGCVSRGPHVVFFFGLLVLALSGLDRLCRTGINNDRHRLTSHQRAPGVVVELAAASSIGTQQNSKARFFFWGNHSQTTSETTTPTVVQHRFAKLQI